MSVGRSLPLKTHVVTVGPSAAQIVNADGQVSPLPKPRVGAYRARCTCGWKSQEFGTEMQAHISGNAHVRVLAAATPVQDTNLPAMLGEPEPLL